MAVTDLQRGFRIGAWQVRPLEGTLTGPSGQERLRPKSMDVLVYLAGKAGELAERDEILRAVWGHAVTDEPLTACIGELRRVLGDDRDNPVYIQTVPKRGYVLRAAVELPEDVPIAAAAANAPAPGADAGTVARLTLLGELQERRVLSVLAAWLAVAAVVVFTVGMMAGWSGPRADVSRAVLLAALLGLPLAGLLTWFIEFSRAGMRRRPPSANSDALLIATALWVVTSLASFAVLGPAERGQDGLNRAGQVSVAVLPFANLSGDPEAAYFSDGISEELLNLLSRIEDLRVPSRTSSFAVRQSGADLAAIAHRLQVEHVLEGSIRKSGKHVRIAVQLIDVPTDSPLWSQTYDRQVDDIFEVQADIARRVAEALQLTLRLGDEKRLRARATRNIEAYDAYLLGRERLQQRTVPSLKEAAALFEKARGLDTHYALADAGLAEAYLMLERYSGGSGGNLRQLAGKALDRALALEPDLPAALSARALLSFTVGDFSAARSTLAKAAAADPRDDSIADRYGSLLTELGDIKKAREVLLRGLERDPVSPTLGYALALNEAAASEVDAAVDRLEALNRLYPERADICAELGELYWRDLAQSSAALGWFERAVAIDPANLRRSAAIAAIHLDRGDPASAASWLEQASSAAPGAPVLLAHRALLYWYQGDRERAREVAEQALALQPRNEIGLMLLVADAARTGRLTEMIERIDSAYPELRSEPPRVDHRNMGAAVRLAYVLEQTGETGRAGVLLDHAGRVAARYPRHGRAYALTDVEVLAVEGDAPAAMAALQAAVGDHWRAYAWWHLDHDPLLQPLRSQPGFDVLRARLLERRKPL